MPLLAALIGCAMALMPAAALATPYFETVQPPSGESRGVVVFFHGGGWLGGSEYVVASRPASNRYAAAGFTVLNVDYTTGAQSVADAYAWYEYARSIADGKPVCVAGESAGGHLALMVAGEYESVGCVIAEAPPTDLETFPEPARGLAAQIFGEGNLRANSPVYHPARSASTRILLVAADHDTVVPSSQANEYKAVRPERTSILKMPYGQEAYWVHVYTTRAAAAQLEEARLDILDQTVRDAGESGNPDDPGDGDAADALRVGEPLVDSRKGVARIPVTAGESGTLDLLGPGVKPRSKGVDEGQRT
jgi:dienelactone hydrolase